MDGDAESETGRVKTKNEEVEEATPRLYLGRKIFDVGCSDGLSAAALWSVSGRDRKCNSCDL